MRARVGVGILNYNGAKHTVRCLDHLEKLDWPAELLQIVVVDNASTDDSVEVIRRAYPEAELVLSSRNRGFAGGCNLAIESMGDVDYVALLNNDAMVEPGWLQPLVRALHDRSDVGAVCSKVLFAARYVDIRLESPTFEPMGLDTRKRGVRLNAVGIGKRKNQDGCFFPSGFYAAELGSGPPGCRWTDGDAVLRVPVDPEGDAVCRLEVSAETTKQLVVSFGDRAKTFTVGKLASRIALDLSGVEGMDMVNNVGSELVDSKNAADRGIFEIDTGQFEDQQEVFAWCGCSVLFSPRYLQDVGVFDERFFLYYEDFDLSWRGQRRGWRYLYEPASVVRHVHAATTGESSELFNFYVWRNRLLVLVKNAPVSVAWGEATGFVVHVFRWLRPELQRRELSETSRTLVQVLASFALNAPAVFADRIRIGVRNRRSPLTRGPAVK
ncbi:MAG: glycosyltransferase family 2 protein [Actinomycetota bacterium]